MTSEEVGLILLSLVMAFIISLTWLDHDGGDPPTF